MAKRTNWWLEGWHYEDQLGGNASRRRKLVYDGEYYSLEKDAGRLPALKVLITVLSMLLTAVYILASVLAKPGAARIFVGACILMIIPLMYLLIGVGCLWPVKDPMTYRDYRGAFLRIRWTSIALALLSGVGVIGAVLHLLFPGDTVRTASEIWWLGGMAFCCTDSLAIAALQHRYHPCMQAKPLV